MKTWRIGRAPDCEVILENAKVSRHHAEFSQTPEGLRIRDLGSSGGTHVNGVRVPPEGSLVRMGDLIAFGKHEVPTRHGPLAPIFEQAPPPRAAAADEPAPARRLQPAPTMSRPERERARGLPASGSVVAWAVAAVVALAAAAGIAYVATQSGDDAAAAEHAAVGAVMPDWAYDAIFMVAVERGGKTIGVGSSFVPEGASSLITNMHVAEELQRCLAQSDCRPLAIGHERAGRPFTVTSVVPHPRSSEMRRGPFKEDIPLRPDVARLEVSDASALPRGLPVGQPEVVSPDLRGSEVFAIGFPGDTMDPSQPAATITRGEVGRIIEGDYIQHSAQISPGSSGSPLLVPGPLVIGINYAAVGLRQVPVVDPAAGGVKIERINQASGINLAAPVRFIRDML